MPVTIDQTSRNDFLFLDPPYRPGRREIKNDHYLPSRFTFDNHKRLAKSLHRATRRGVKWALTISPHKDILAMFPRHKFLTFKWGVGNSPGIITNDTGEVLIRNH